MVNWLLTSCSWRSVSFLLYLLVVDLLQCLWYSIVCMILFACPSSLDDLLHYDGESIKLAMDLAC